jgi:hypothetical protein
MGIIKEGIAEYQLLEDFSEYILLNDLKGGFILGTSTAYIKDVYWLLNGVRPDIA